MELVKPTYRIASIDILRGLVMIIMALDHVRDFFHQPAFIYDPLDLEKTTPAIFLTRWVTHFCAPTFVFLSGISAFLSSQKKTPKEASLFLIKRGLWLVAVEIVIITFGITFKPFTIILWQVIWAIGWSMVLLGILMRISYKAVLVIGLILFFGHNILDLVNLNTTGTTGLLWRIFLTSSGTVFFLDANHMVLAAYAILPWTGVMLLGFSIGYWFKRDFPAERRKKLLLITGLGLIVLFILLRYTGIYGNPSPWVRQETFVNNILAFINTSKYPPSLLFLCMTLGPGCLFLVLLENVKTKWSRIVSVYGSVPFFYFVLHFYLIHIICVIMFFATGHRTDEISDPRVLMSFRPFNFGFSLPVVYLIWLAVVGLLYLPCRWFAMYKRSHTQWWLSYL